jgi:hypothetical protein
VFAKCSIDENRITNLIQQRLKKIILEGEFSHNLADEKSLAILVLNTTLIGNEKHFLVTISVIENLSTTLINYRYPKVHYH